ncbi:MAG: hypothetical protein HPZ91_01480 [Lentisphaeria bacterium]|nr:hypothetical protein [Lentisphaeria bacterium]
MNRAFAAIAAAAGMLPAVLSAAPPESETSRTIRLVQDDAQEYMVSKVYQLKHLKANDVTPFLLGVVKRYNTQSTVNRINYKAGDEQLLTVSCPVKMMPYVDDLLAKLDRPSRIAGSGDGDPIRGTGIVRNIYPAKFRSAQVMVDIMTGTGVNGGADSFVGYDATTNIIYWKDDFNKSNDLLKYLAWLDRPAPMANIAFTVYEVRDSTLRDLGIDYLSWRNGPGLDLLQAGFNAMSLDSAGSAALSAASGGFGAFFIAPQFDASFIRVLEQNGRADIANSATLTVSNSEKASYSVGFSPQSQAIFKRDNDQLQVGISGVGMKGGINQPESGPGASNPLLNSDTPPPPLSLTVTAPRINLRGPADAKTGLLPDAAADWNRNLQALVTFQYLIRTADVVERNNYGAELAEVSSVTGECNLLSGEEKLLTVWSKESEVEQTIGVPFLSDIPVLKYLFSTTTVNREKTYFFVTAKTILAHPESLPSEYGGQLKSLSELIPQNATR